MPIMLVIVVTTKMSPAAAAAAAKSLQSCPTLCDPIDGRPPGSPVPGILYAGTLEWVAISFSGHLQMSPRQKLPLIETHRARSFSQ